MVAAQCLQTHNNIMEIIEYNFVIYVDFANILTNEMYYCWAMVSLFFTQRPRDRYTAPLYQKPELFLKTLWGEL